MFCFGADMMILQFIVRHALKCARYEATMSLLEFKYFYLLIAPILTNFIL